MSPWSLAECIRYYLITVSPLYRAKSRDVGCAKNAVRQVFARIDASGRWLITNAVRLGNSGLKVSKIILGTMQYGDKNWQEWVLDEEQAIEHIKYA